MAVLWRISRTIARELGLAAWRWMASESQIPNVD
jgi:hypothetical protein